jgi:DNA-binding NtrC family response regulator
MSSPRILIVDDEQGMTRSIERVLGQHYKVAATQSSRDAIAVMEAFKPDLAILDVQMPELDGFDLMERLRTIDPELEVIFMTGSVHELDSKLVRAIRKDAFYFLQKPFDREVLLTLVERCLELKRLDQENKKHVLRIEKELAEARAFQQALLPPAMPNWEESRFLPAAFPARSLQVIFMITPQLERARRRSLLPTFQDTAPAQLC